MLSTYRDKGGGFSQHAFCSCLLRGEHRTPFFVFLFRLFPALFPLPLLILAFFLRTCQGCSPPLGLKSTSRTYVWAPGRASCTLWLRHCCSPTSPSGAGWVQPLFRGIPSRELLLHPQTSPKGRLLFCIRCTSCRTPSCSRRRPPKGDLCSTRSEHA